MKITKNFRKPDIGVDINKDGHCDLCGKFVNKFGRHSLSYLIIKNDIKTVIKISQEKSDDGKMDILSFVNSHYYKNPYLVADDKDFNYYATYIQDYTLNDNSVDYCRKDINDFLRFEILRNGLDKNIMEYVIDCMNSAISKFVVKNYVVGYRGMAFSNSNIEYVKMLRKIDCLLNHGETGTEWVDYVDNGFTSISRKKNHAAKFSQLNGNNKVSVLFKVIAVEGSCGMPLSEKYDTTFDEDEKEILLMPGQINRFVQIERKVINGNEYYTGIIIVKRRQ